jgi:hypothetical protein
MSHGTIGEESNRLIMNEGIPTFAFFIHGFARQIGATQSQAITSKSEALGLPGLSILQGKESMAIPYSPLNDVRSSLLISCFAAIPRNSGPIM